jgi:hypothetical protein
MNFGFHERQDFLFLAELLLLFSIICVGLIGFDVAELILIPSGCLYIRNNSRSTERIFIKFDMGSYNKMCHRNLKLVKIGQK